MGAVPLWLAKLSLSGKRAALRSGPQAYADAVIQVGAHDAPGASCRFASADA
jgi:hypothetical protein